jgi:ribose 1,5-bisphosphokinase PhnN
MGKRKMYNTTLDTDLTKKLRILAAQLEKRQNDLLEETIQDLQKNMNKRVKNKDVKTIPRMPFV